MFVVFAKINSSGVRFMLGKPVFEILRMFKSGKLKLHKTRQQM